MAQTQSFTATASGTNSATGDALAAEADFVWDENGHITVTLTNTAAQGAKAQSDILTGLEIQGTGSGLTPLTAAMSAGSTALNFSSSYNLGNEWQYLSGVNGPHSTNWGISSTGLGVFGPDGNFGANNPDNLDGAAYGIVNSVDPNANGPTQGYALVQGGMVFTLNTGVGFNATSFQNLASSLYFQYGTSTSEPELQGSLSSISAGGGASNTPEPGTVSMAVCAGAGTLLGGFRKLRVKRTK
jgi:hypothetical protein